MKIIQTIADMRSWRQTAGNLAFVPTMGNLHQGHFALVKEARAHADRVVVSIFVNRLQFAPSEDLDTYPRTFADDSLRLCAEGVDVLFYPDEQELYPGMRQDFYIEPMPICNELCGTFRPGHFRGVVTVVSKLFNIVQPEIACFGKKDFQQLHMIRSMVQALNMPVEIIAVETLRTKEGLAFSSRNSYLNTSERGEAPRLYRNLCRIRDALLAGHQNYRELENVACVDLIKAGWRVDYIEVREADTLEIASSDERHLVVLAAAHLGCTRLIDNIEVFR